MNRIRWAVLTLALLAFAAIGILRAQGPAAPPSGSVASYNATAQGANISATTFFTMPAASNAIGSPTNSAGKYWFECYVVTTTAATTSSTMPACNVTFTDSDSATAESATAATTTSTANAKGTFQQGAVLIDPLAGSAVQISTSSYASSGATALAYSVHASLEYVGN